MNRFLISAAAIAMTAPAAFAGGVVEPAPAQVIAPVAPVSDWTGGYVGLQFGTTLDSTITIGGVPSDLDATLYGVFGGYRFDFGNFVVGGELDYMMGDGEVAAPGGFDLDVDDLVRLGLEAGYDLGNTLVYGTAGFAQIGITDEFGTSDDSSGYFYGIGADFRVTDSVTIGVEVLRHEFDDFSLPNELEATTVGLNAAFTF